SAEQVGDGASAPSEDGGQRPQDEAPMSRSGQGRGPGLEDGRDRLGKRAADPLELASAQASLSGRLAAVVPPRPFLPASAQARLWGAVTVSGIVRVAPWCRGRPLGTPLVDTGHGSLLVCDVRGRSYPPLHRGGSPRRKPRKGKESNIEEVAGGDKFLLDLIEEALKVRSGADGNGDGR